MAIGKAFVVLQISCSPGDDPLLRVFDEAYHRDGELPGLWRAEMFEVLDPTVPSNWTVQIGGAATAGYVNIGPESWQRPGFWDDLDEWSELGKRAQEDYSRELAVMVREAARP